MIYTCQHCGADFSANDMRKAVNNNETIITCKYCNKLTVFRTRGLSHIVKGFDYLSIGDFYLAMLSFNTAIEETLAHKETPSSDAYLGAALAQFRVQALFYDEKGDRLKKPRLTCQQRNEMYFADSKNYADALRVLKENAGDKKYREELDNLQYCQHMIDDIKDYYDQIEASKPKDFNYSVFIAYEDKPQIDSDNRGFEFALKVRNSLPDEVKNIFLPDIEDGDYENELHYEAAILYAIEHSKCMLVITDDSIDSRLINQYSRFYFSDYSGGHQDEHGKNLGFIRYCGRITISLPDKTIAEKNVFDIENKEDYIRFVCTHNNIFRRVGQIVPEAKTSENTIKNELAIGISSSHHKDYKMLPGKQLAFGHYPQKREASKEVEEYFLKFGKPMPSDNKGWHEMFFNRKGTPYMWYRDENFNGKKYRAVYFLKFREEYSVQESNIPARQQRLHGYMPLRIYCFSFEPLIWDIEDMSSNMAVLVAIHGIDSREYNNVVLDSEWSHSTIKEWLNHEFVHTAFEDTEARLLCSINGDEEQDKVFLIDKTFDKPFYYNRHNAILGSDYYKCIGGMGDRSINSCWITDIDNHHLQEASVIDPLEHYSISTAYVDSTVVAVVPKIILKL